MCERGATEGASGRPVAGAPITHRFPLSRAPEAVAVSLDKGSGVVKAMLLPCPDLLAPNAVLTAVRERRSLPGAHRGVRARQTLWPEELQEAADDQDAD